MSRLPQSAPDAVQHAFRVKTKGRPGPAKESDVPPPRPFPRRKPVVIPGQLVLGQDASDEKPAP
jgi:hypothetical protein